MEIIVVSDGPNRHAIKRSLCRQRRVKDLVISLHTIENALKRSFTGEEIFIFEMGAHLKEYKNLMERLLKKNVRMCAFIPSKRERDLQIFTTHPFRNSVVKRGVRDSVAWALAQVQH